MTFTFSLTHTRLAWLEFVWLSNWKFHTVRTSGVFVISVNIWLYCTGDGIKWAYHDRNEQTKSRRNERERYRSSEYNESNSGIFLSTPNREYRITTIYMYVCVCVCVFVFYFEWTFVCAHLQFRNLTTIQLIICIYTSDCFFCISDFCLTQLIVRSIHLNFQANMNILLCECDFMFKHRSVHGHEKLFSGI